MSHHATSTSLRDRASAVLYSAMARLDVVSRALPRLHDEAVSTLVAEADPGVEQRLLDVRCGAVPLLYHLRPYLPSRRIAYVGVGLSAQEINPLQREAFDVAVAPYTKFVKADLLTTLPLSSSSIDVAFVTFTLHTFAATHERTAFLREVRRILVPHGRLHIAEPSDDYNADCAVGDCMRRDEETALPPIERAWNIQVGYPSLQRQCRTLVENIRTGRCYGYRETTLRRELEAAGFVVDSARAVENSSVWLAHAHRAEKPA